MSSITDLRYAPLSLEKAGTCISKNECQSVGKASGAISSQPDTF